MEELRKEFELWGWKWETCMESKRPLHSTDPRYYVNQNNVIINDNTLTLTIDHKPRIIKWFDLGWTLPMIDYTPEYSCGLIKSVDTVQVNSIIEADLKFPKGANLWPSFWLTACDSWPPEIDIVEAYTDKKGSYKDGWNFHWKWPFIYRELRFESNVHYKGLKDEHLFTGAKCVHPKVIKKPIEDNWNNFKCVWKEDIIELYVNGHLVRTITDEYVLSKMKTTGMWVIFNMWPNKQFQKSDLNNPEFKIKNFKVTKL